MEKYSQFRDKGTAIAPFLPVPSPPANVLWTPVHAVLFALRLFPVLSISLLYFLLLEILPIPTIIKKCVLWLLLAVPGVWWVDLQVDGVKRGRLSDKQAAGSLPKEGDIVASSFTSPLDPLYLAGIFCPVFVRTWPGEKGVQVITLWGAICMAFSRPQLQSPKGAKLVGLKELSRKYPGSIICVFPESTTTNGRGILPLSPALLTADSKTKIYPVNLRYTPGDITTPVPGGAFNWVWKLLSKPTHQMRVRIARPVYNSPSIDTPSTTKSVKASGVDMGYETNIWDSPHMRNGVHDGEEKGDVGQQVLDRVGEDLARLGRVKRVGLGVREKTEFVKIWKSRRR
ncbi:Lysophosphatidic acid:oleoyl-CoA acyltransferase 1 [Paraconiothyrium brasiliense]|uniref:Lysophosphatidic acid:oleoyl-CoA acyltransferase 1 n=1 Tax=Paraconiothyrium brasiliense TaxID=300254 RepID=A0ABR3RQK0_9PLEO